MNILLIGGTGILSTDVCSEALRRGNTVYMLNRGTRAYAFNEQAILIKGDIRKDSIRELRSKVGNVSYDVVIDFLTFNPDQMKKTLEIIKGVCSQYVFISSATAYQKSNEEEVITEKTSIGNSNWDYAYQKSLCENWLAENYKSFVNSWTVIRPYVTYNETRIPYAIVSDGYYWAFVNRINIGKPIILWDSGKAKCTITNTKDFAVGVVGTFGNEKAYQEAFHVTSDERLTWRTVLDTIVAVNGKTAEIIDMQSDEICKVLPEFKGVLYGDKGTNMLFDNSKIKQVVPDFKTNIYFKDGIKDTLKYLNQHKELHIINFIMEGRLDYLSEYYYRRNKIKFSKKILSIKLFKDNGQINGFKDVIKYNIGRKPVLFFTYNMVRIYGRRVKILVQELLGK